jgi:hypothetical protein
MDKGDRGSRGGGGGGTEDQWIDCQNPQRVLQDVTETGDRGDVFTTTTNLFRVNYDGTGFDVVPNSTASIRIIDNVTQDEVTLATLDAAAAESVFMNAAPGTYLLVVDIEPEHGATYTVSVDEGSGTTPAPPDKQRVRERLDRIERRLDRIERRLDRIERRLDRIEGHGERPGGDRGEGPRGDRGGGRGRG